MNNSVQATPNPDSVAINEDNDRLNNAVFCDEMTIKKITMSQYLGKYSVTIDKLGCFVTAPMKRTTFGCRSRFMIET